MPPLDASTLRAVAAAQEGAREPAASPLVPITLAELLELEIPPRRWLVRGLLRERSLALVYAARGRGKSWFTLSLAYAAATGGRFLRWEAPHPVETLYVDGEMAADEVKGRLARIVEADDRPAAESRLRILCSDLQPSGVPNLATEDGQAALEPLLSGVRFLIVDNVACLLRTVDENDAAAWGPVASWLLGLRRRGVAVVLVAHAGKSAHAGARGTSAREDLLDLVLGLHRPPDLRAEDGAAFTVRFEKARALTSAESADLRVELRDGPDGAILWTFGTDREGTKREALLRLRNGEPATSIRRELNVPAATLYDWRAAWIESGELEAPRGKRK